MINRRLVRETVLQAIYAHHQSGDSLQHIIDTIIKKNVGKEREARRFAEKLFFKALEHEEDFNKIITSHIKNWDIRRLALIDRIIINIGLCEFLQFEEIPTKVTINEAIEIAKKYSTAKSGRFVNGILDASLLELKRNNNIKKTGRGLIDKSTGK